MKVLISLILISTFLCACGGPVEISDDEVTAETTDDSGNTNNPGSGENPSSDTENNSENKPDSGNQQVPGENVIKVKAVLDCRPTENSSVAQVSKKINMMALGSCVVNENNECVGNPDDYTMMYKWRFIEKTAQTQLFVVVSELNSWKDYENEWLIDEGSFSFFEATSVAPNNINKKQNFTPEDDCENFFNSKKPHDPYTRQKRLKEWNEKCDIYANNDYLIELQVKAVHKETGKESEVGSTYCSPTVYPRARVRIKLSEAQDVAPAKVDLDLHLIKMRSLYNSRYDDPWDFDDNPWDSFPENGNIEGDTWQDSPDYAKGFMCTNQKTESHDDCSSNDVSLFTSSWYANLISAGNLHNTNDEIIHFAQDYPTMTLFSDLNDEYLIVANYSDCDDSETEADGYKCDQPFEAGLEILIDEKPHAMGSRVDLDQKIPEKFKISKNQWIVLGKFQWNNQLNGEIQKNYGKDYRGDARVENLLSEYKVCKLPTDKCQNAPIWDKETYYQWVEKIGEQYNMKDQVECYPYNPGK